MNERVTRLVQGGLLVASLVLLAGPSTWFPSLYRPRLMALTAVVYVLCIQLPVWVFRLPRGRAANDDLELLKRRTNLQVGLALGFALSGLGSLGLWGLHEVGIPYDAIVHAAFSGLIMACGAPMLSAWYGLSRTKAILVVGVLVACSGVAWELVELASDRLLQFGYFGELFDRNSIFDLVANIAGASVGSVFADWSRSDRADRLRRLLTILVIFLIGVGVYALSSMEYRVTIESQVTPAPTTASSGGTMLFVGDIMLSRSVGARMQEVGDYTYPFHAIADTLREADIAFANLENPVSARGVNVGSKYSFRADPRVIQGLQCTGIDVVSLANNHIWDYGREAFIDTMQHLRDGGIDYVGAGNTFDEAHRGVTRSVGGVNVVFLAYTNLISPQVAATDTTPGVAYLNTEQMVRDIGDARLRGDVVVASFHWGDEYQVIHNAQQDRIAKMAIDAGADLIIGHHPHVVQEVQQYGDGWIAYSLGNFIFDQTFSEETMRGLALRVTLDGSRIGAVESLGISISRQYQPSLSQ